MSTLPIRPDAPWLAPLAGWSDLPFRLLCREQGAAVCCTEMVSAKGLVYGGRNTGELLASTPDAGELLEDGSLVCDRPLVVQIFGAEAGFMEHAVRILQDRGFCWFDVNMGCSVPKVTKTGAGSAMLRDVENALRVAEAVVRAAGEGHVGFKLRLGWDREHEVYRNLATRLAGMGAGWITLHPRHAVQGFSGTPRLSALAELAGELSLPVIASGDLFTASEGLRVLQETGVSAVMYARGALRDPAIFARHRELFATGELPASHISPESGKPPSAQHACDVLEGLPVDRRRIAKIIRRHALLARHYSPQVAVLKMRTALPRYVKGWSGARALRQDLVTCRDWDTLNAVLEKHFVCAGSAQDAECHV